MPSERPCPYRSLSAGHIRLLRVAPPSGQNDPITISIEHASLDDNVAFKAISYTWGDATPSHQVHVSGKEGMCGYLTIRRNLQEFLCQWRRNTEQCNSLLWIDQISIDQSNEAEKSHQVQQMSSIFGKASQVISWLGPGDEESDKLMAMFRGDGQMGKFHHDFFVENEAILQRFLDLAYWKRLWIIQEMMLASELILQWGAQQFPWRFEDVQKREAWFVFTAIKTTGLATLDGNLQRIYSLNEMRCRWSARPQQIGWKGLAEYAASSECSEIKDKVFGLLSLACPEEQLVADYSLSTEDLFWQLFDKAGPQAHSELRADMYGWLYDWRDILGLQLRVPPELIVQRLEQRIQAAYQYEDLVHWFNAYVGQWLRMQMDGRWTHFGFR